MTQQPYYQPQPAPQQYQAPAPQQFQQPYAQPAPQAYAPQFPGQGYPPQQYGQPAPQQAPAVPLATGTIDDYYSQPSAGGGPAISWSVNNMPKPEGTSYVGIVARDVTNADIQQQTDPKTGQPKFYRDGRPQFVMKVPLKLQPTPEFPDGEAVLFVRGQMRDELVRAMTEAGGAREPKAGDVLQVTLVQRKPSRGGGMPMNVFQIGYRAANPASNTAQGQAATLPSSGAPSPAPEVQQQAPQPLQQPVQQFEQAPAQQYQQPVQQPVQQAQPQYQAPAPQPVAQVQQPVQPQQVQPGAPQPPAGLNPEQQALIASLTNPGAQG